MSKRIKAIWGIIKEHKLVFIAFFIVSILSTFLIPYLLNEPIYTTPIALVSGFIFVALLIRFSLFTK